MFLEIQQIKKHFGEGESRVEVLKGIDIGIEKHQILTMNSPMPLISMILRGLIFLSIKVPPRVVPIQKPR